jgi:hypothetical protein
MLRWKRNAQRNPSSWCHESQALAQDGAASPVQLGGGLNVHSAKADTSTRARPISPVSACRKLVAACSVVKVLRLRTRDASNVSANELSWWIGPADLADLGFRLEAR